MEYDVCIVGGGPAGLSAAIRLRQLAQDKGTDLSVCVVEKGSEVGSHVLSGNVFEPRALTELIPDWKEKGAPLETPAREDSFHFLFSDSRSFKVPFVPPSLHNDGNYIISLGALTKWLASQAEQLGVEIYPGFAASEILYGEKGEVSGVATNDVGVSRQGRPKDTFQRGLALRAKQTIFAEGCRGSLSERLIKQFDLREGRAEQTYGLGIKEVWEVPSQNHSPGKILHTIGWPVQKLSDSKSPWAGGFLYHMKPNLVLLGYVVGLDYKNPYLSPYQEFQRWKTHPVIRKELKDGQVVSYGARTLNEGGLQSVPKLSVPGGLLVGCSAGFLNVAKIKGTHTAMKSAMIAAEEVYTTLTQQEPSQEGSRVGALEITSYETRLRQSWIWNELHQFRNIHPSYHWGFVPWLAYSALDLFFLKGRVPFTLGERNKKKDSEVTEPKHLHQPIDYPKPDGVLTFDLLTNLARSGTNHEHDQPIHLRLKEGREEKGPERSYEFFGGPEQYFCPARVYEYSLNDHSQKPQLIRNAQNCLHCKACSIKTPGEYIEWCTPEGGGGPAYSNM